MHLANPRRYRSWLVRSLAALCMTTVVAWASPGASPVASAALAPYEQTDARWAYTGSWFAHGAPAFSGSSHTFTNVTGAEVTFAFAGTGFDLVSTTGPKFGVAAIIVDGGAPQYVDLYAADAAFQQTVFSAAGLEDCLHVVRVVCTGSKRPEATDAFISVDAAAVSGTPSALPVETSDGRVAKKGSWFTAGAAGSSGGDFLIANGAGDEAVIAFTGSGVDLVGTTGPNYGIASVSVDGGAPVQIDTYAPTLRHRRIIFSTQGLPWGPHVVRVVCGGRHSAMASDSYVGLDAVLPQGTLTQATVRYEEYDPRFAWGGSLAETWAAGLSGARYVWSGPSWGAASVAFDGARLDWIAAMGPQYGIASVRVDGGAPQDVDLYAPDTRLQQAVFSTGDLPVGRHTAVISWTGRANAVASGTYVSFDAFDIGGVPAQAAPPGPPVDPATFAYPWVRYIVVDKSELRLYLVENGLLVRMYPVATGRPSMPTPSGIWRIDAKYYTDPTSVYGPRKMRLFRQSGSGFSFTAYGIHGTDTDSSISTYASHGCIRLHNYDILELFDMVPLGTMVVTRD